MNHIELHDQEIEILMENCESIKVDMWAIKTLRFDTICDRYTWDESHKDFLHSTIIDNVKMVFDIREWKHFHHAPRLIDSATLKEDGEKCIDRLRYCDDITHIYINGKSFSIPWHNEEAGRDSFDIPWYKNAWQKNTESTNSIDGHPLLTIEIRRQDKK